MPGVSARLVTNLSSRDAKVVAAAKALALLLFPSKREGVQCLSAEHDSGHADVRRAIPALTRSAHLTCAIGAKSVEGRTLQEALDQTDQTVRSQDHIVIEEHHPGVRAELSRLVACVGDRLNAMAVVGLGSSHLAMYHHV
jgi:hypothetical protein